MGDENLQRGGIQVRDYTHGRRLELNRLPGQEKNSFNTVGRLLGVFSLGLGLAEVFMPKRIQKLAGVRGDHSGIFRFLGIRELIHAALIFTQARLYPGIWSRVFGDGIDIATIGAAFTLPRTKKNRAAAVTAALAGVTALDVVTASQISSTQPRLMGYSDLKREDLHGRTRGGAFRATRSVTINRSPEELYRFWHDFTRLPQFMYHLQDVQVLDEQRSHWVTKAPAGRQVSWDAQITQDRPNELIAWESIGDADVPNSGQVRFVPAPTGRGTVVRVTLEYHPPAGAAGRVVAMLFGEESGQQVNADLHRFKQVMETGEVLRSDGSPEGFGEKAQHPAQPMPDGHIAEKVSTANPPKRRTKTAVKE